MFAFAATVTVLKMVLRFDQDDNTQGKLTPLACYLVTLLPFFAWRHPLTENKYRSARASTDVKYLKLTKKKCFVIFISLLVVSLKNSA